MVLVTPSTSEILPNILPASTVIPTHQQRLLVYADMGPAKTARIIELDLARIRVGAS